MKWAFVEVLLGKDDLCSVVWFYDRSQILHRKKLTSKKKASFTLQTIF